MRLRGLFEMNTRKVIRENVFLRNSQLISRDIIEAFLRFTILVCCVEKKVNVLFLMEFIK